MKKILFSLFASLLFLVPSFASAQGNLGSHHSETTFLLNQSGEQSTIVYLPIPRTGWPVRVHLSAVDPIEISVQAMTSFTIIDGVTGNPYMTVPLPMALGTPVSCQDNGPDAVVECAIGTNGSVVAVGYTDVTSNQPHRMFVKLFNCNCALQFRISMWY